MATDFQMNPQVAAYLEELRKRQERMNDPEYLARSEGPAPEGFGSAGNIAGLGKAFSQFGSLGGKTGDTSALEENANAVEQQRANDLKMLAQNSARRDNKFAMNDKVMMHLQDQQLAAQAAKDKMKADQDFKMAEADKDRGLRRDLAAENANVRKDMLAAKPPVKDTAEEKTAAYHALRAEDASDLLSQIEKSGYDPADYGRAARNMRIPLLGAQPMANQEDRAYKQAQEEFIASVLRKESGAAVSPQEFDRYASIYFPAPGDNKQIIQQKAVARDRAVQNLKGMAGNAYNPANRTQYTYKPEAKEGTAMAAEEKKPVLPPPPAGKVRVKSPSGKIGFIPAEDLEQALREEYQEIK